MVGITRRKVFFVPSMLGPIKIHDALILDLPYSPTVRSTCQHGCGKHVPRRTWKSTRVGVRFTSILRLKNDGKF